MSLTIGPSRLWVSRVNSPTSTWTAVYGESVTNPFGQVSNDRFTVSSIDTSELPTSSFGDVTEEYSFFFRASDPRYPESIVRACWSDWSSQDNAPLELRGKLTVTP